MPPKIGQKQSWGDRLSADAQAPAESAPLNIPEPAPMDRAFDPVGDYESKQERLQELEVEVMVLRRELHLAKARILELELKARGIHVG